MSVGSKVSERYAQGAREVEPSLCCPVQYDASLLKLLPQEIIDKDYGCGDPSRYVQPGDIVLDLGSGGGKICYMAAQLVGDRGYVIGIDMTDDMLALARKYRDEMALKLGSDRVSFRKGYIQDLALDVDAMEDWLELHPVNNAAGLQALEDWKKQQRSEAPLVADDSVDIVVSNCVLNLVDEADRKQMIEGIFRVLKPGGRVAVSDIVCDEAIPQHLKDDATLWSGCISGAYHEKSFLQAFLDVGFVAVATDKWDAEPWQTVEGIEFRSVTVIAVKPSPADCLDIGQAVIYRGPFREVWDDEGHVYPRGERIAVCQRTYDFLTTGPLKESFIGIQPAIPRPAAYFCSPAGTVRPAIETRGGIHATGGSSSSCC